MIRRSCLRMEEMVTMLWEFVLNVTFVVSGM